MSGPTVVLLHGGPGAGGYLAPLARALEDSFRLLEPLQRGSGGGRLTVATHVADLDSFIEKHCADRPPALVGHSWGAMLALAHAATHPCRASSLVLVGCGTFDPESRAVFQAAVEARLDEELRRRIDRLPADFPDPDERLRRLGDLMLPPYSYELEDRALETETCDAQAGEESWQDMLRLQETGVYPAAFAAIRAPVLMLHGDVDPHPGPLVRTTLQRFIPQLEYRELRRCGHYPWLERHARSEFFVALRQRLAPADAGS